MQQRTALISGAGVAGPALAYWLNATGWTTTIVEHATRPRSGGYVIDFWGLGYDLAERMGLLGKIEAIGYRAREFRIVGDNGRRIAGFGTLVFDELTNGRYVTIPRSGLARLLLDAATRSTDLRLGDEVVAIADGGAAVDVTFRSGEKQRFDLVIGADGLRSGVRRLVFGPDESFEKPLGYAVAAFECSGYRPRDPDVYVMHCKPGRMLGRFALHDDRSLFLFVFALDVPPPKTTAARRELLSSLYADDDWETPAILRRLHDAPDLYVDRVSQMRMPRWSSGRVALVGDAAFCVSLLAGQGSALAMIAAYVLAGELARPNSDIQQALSAYETRLRDFIETKQAGALRFAGAFAPRTRLGLWFRNQVANSLRVPGLAKLFVGRDLMDRLPLPDYPMGPKAQAPWSGEGPQ